MTSYSDVTTKIADQWVAAFKGAGDSLATLSDNTRKATAKFDAPAFPVPEQVTKLTEAITEQLPQPAEIIQANFELATRLLGAQRDFALRVLELGESAAATEAAPAAKKAASR